MLMQSLDTHPKIEKFQILLIRKASIVKRISRMRSLSQTTIELSRRAISRANPELNEEELNLLFVAYHYGTDLANRLQKYLNKKDIKNIMKTPDIVIALEPVIKAFEVLDVSYYIGGSVASSTYGIARATLDVDIISNLKSSNVQLLVEILESIYYIDKNMILDAIHRCASFNIIHLETMLKVDIFIPKDNPYNEEAFRRRRKDTLSDEQGTPEFYLASPEDIILSKIEWFHLGGNVSERQWFDVLGVLKVQGNLLDMEYLKHWAVELGLIDLFEQALLDAGN